MDQWKFLFETDLENQRSFEKRKGKREGTRNIPKEVENIEKLHTVCEVLWLRFFHDREREQGGEQGEKISGRKY